MFVNTLQSAKTSPWLASSFAWSNGNKKLTFTIRSGVKWTDGKPLTAADVLYSFNLLKKYKALDLNAVWSVLSGVTQQGNQVVMTFKAPAVTYFYYIADQMAIVPQHIWSTISDPVKYPDTHPVGTGAYTMSNCTPQNITYKANPHYWQPGKPKIDTVNYPAFTSNDTANTYLANGQAQWGSQFIPSIQTFYLDKSPNYHYWFPPVANVTLFINLTNPILKNVAVRQAMAYAINRQRVSTIGEYGYEPPSNQTGIVTPTFSSWLDQSQAAGFGSNYAYNPAKAISILTAAGFKKGPDGIMAKGGQKLSFTHRQHRRLLRLGRLGQRHPAEPQGRRHPGHAEEPGPNRPSDGDIYTGKYDLAYNRRPAGPRRTTSCASGCTRGNSAPIGQPAGSNWERYSNPATDALINSYATTTDSAQQHAIVTKLQKVMLQEVPVIPITESVDWYQYDTGTFNGWVTQSNPYAQPAAYSYPDWGQQMMNLQPAK